MLEKLTPEAKDVISASRVFAMELKSKTIGLEHLSFALTTVKKSLAYQLLNELTDVLKVGGRFWKKMVLGNRSSPKLIQFNSQVKTILGRAYLEAVESNEEWINSKHILLALLNAKTSSCIFNRMGLSYKKVKKHILSSVINCNQKTR